MSKEYECVELSIKTELQHLEQSINLCTFRTRITETVYVVKGISSECAAKPTLNMWWKKGFYILSIPMFLLVFILNFIEAILTDIWKCFRLMKSIKALKRYKIDLTEPQDKTLSNLWVYHGLNHKQIPIEVCITLLHQWIRILYGKEVSDRFDLNMMYHGTFQKEFTLNKAHYKNQSKGCRFHTGDKFLGVIRQVESSLPKYG